jgi:Domain of unknown function (DUF1963)
MNVEELVARLEPWRKKHRRDAYLPRLGSAPSSSRFGGQPDMAPGEPWPSCASCKAPMLFVLQIDLARSPASHFGSGLLQLFYCATDAGDCETWAPFSGANLPRIVSGDLSRARPPAGLPVHREEMLLGWERVDDYPDPQEHEELGLEYHYDFKKSAVRIVCPELGIDEAHLDVAKYTAEAIASARQGEKLLGWPSWVQGVEYPSCPACGERMRFAFQVDSEKNVPLMFGDCGIGHITQCPSHPETLAFGWACS